MAIPKTIDFSNLNHEQIFNSDSKQYRLLNKIPDNSWGNYCNKMIGKGISITYNAEGDYFAAKPQKMKVKENLMRENKKILLEIGDKVKFKNKENEIIQGTIEWLNEDNEVEISLPNGTIGIYTTQEVLNGKKLYEANHRFKSPLTEDEKRSLLFDQEDEDEEIEDSDDEHVLLNDDPEEDEEIDFDDEIDDLAGSVDFDDEEHEDEIVDNTMNTLETKGISSPSTISLDDLEALLNKILAKNTSQGSSVPEQHPNGEAEEVNETVPSLGKGPRPNVLDTDFTDTEGLNGDEEMLKAVYGHSDGEILDKEFPEIQDKIEVAKNKIENEPSYNEYLTGDEEEFNTYDHRSDDYTEEGEYLLDDEDFERNASLSSGLGAYSTSEEVGDIFEDGDAEEIIGELEPAESLPSVSANTELPKENIPATTPTINKTVNCNGTPIQVVLTGVILTMPEIKAITESVKKQGLKVIKLESNKATELNIIVEGFNKKYKINYQDVNKSRNKTPFSIKHEKFQSLIEALERIKGINKKNLIEKKNFSKFNDKDLLNRSIGGNITESTLKTDYSDAIKKNISSWNVKAVGSVNLKTGLNEAYSNIISHSKEKNTLIKTRDGQFYLMKGNLKERSKVGIVKELVDVENKKGYGIGKVVGIFDNTAKGLGQIMYHTKRTSLPLLIWK